MRNDAAQQNALSIDLEDYFQVSNFESLVSRRDWPKFELRAAQNTRRVLAILSEYDVRATFFILGWTAERIPALIRQVRQAGHEIACHGHDHRLLYEITPEAFRNDIMKCKRVLEDLTGARPIGYRAPSFSVTQDSLWALDILAEQGFRYDSSVAPTGCHDRYGIADAEVFPHEIRTPSGPLIEFPVSTVTLLGKRIPTCGGGYLRFFPTWFIKRCIRKINDLRMPAMVYLHPWELDVDQPRIPAGTLATLRHYVNLHKTEAKLHSLLSEFRFGPVWETLQSLDISERLPMDETNLALAAG